MLAIESSCDETAAALVTRERRVLANIVATQTDQSIAELKSRWDLWLDLPNTPQEYIRVDDIDEAVQSIWVMLDGLISMRISSPEYDWKDTHVDVSLEILLRGLVAPNGAPGGCGEAR